MSSPGAGGLDVGANIASPIQPHKSSAKSARFTSFPRPPTLPSPNEIYAESSTQVVRRTSALALRTMASSPNMSACASQARKLPWCLYLPGFCIHSAPADAEDELHHAIPDFPSSFIFQPFVEHPIHDHPVFHSPLPANMAPSPTAMRSPAPVVAGPIFPEPQKLIHDDKAFENTSTSVAASQMRNALNNLADTVTDPEEKKVRITPIFLLHRMETDFAPALRDRDG